MKIDKPVIKIEVTPRELLLMTYCVDELLCITKEMNLMRGFDLGKQTECDRLASDLNKVIDAFQCIK